MMTTFARGLADSGVITWRNLINARRTSDWVISAIVEPVMFVLLFSLVLGNAIGGPSESATYRDFVISGAFTQMAVLNSTFTVVGFANDLKKGIVERFRSLPMARSAVLLGRANSDLIRSGIGLATISLCGLLIGWRIHGSAFDAILAYLVMLLFTFGLFWFVALVGLFARSVETAQGLSMVWIFPIIYISSALVPTADLPGFLRVIGDWNPLTAVADTTRNLFGNHFGPTPTGWPAEHALLYAVVCCVALVAIFAPLAVFKYQRVSTK